MMKKKFCVKEQLIDYSPYDKRYNTDSLLQFSYTLEDENYLSDELSLSVSLNAKDEIIQKNIDVLELEKLYQIHADVVQECIKRGLMYSEDYVHNIINVYPELFETNDVTRDAVYIFKLFIVSF